MKVNGQAIKDIKKYREYIKYATKSDLKVQVSSTYLGYFWWILDPIMQMLVYMVFVLIIFKKGEENFPIFIFSAILPWKWFISSIMDSTNAIRSKVGLLRQVYLPKFILPLNKVFVNTYKFLFSFIVLFVLVILFKVPITIHYLEIIIIFIINIIFICSLSLFFAHIGVYFKDIKNILVFSTKLWFYLTPCLYSLDRVPQNLRMLWWINPMTSFIESYRNVILYGKSPYYLMLSIWLIFSLILMHSSLKVLYKHDKNYTKVI
ncbi:ABC transporter permease [Oceanirhabdus seepicola]|uniref:Transport permease protein n=1 Tax=Oceanirhabdus seepicola TaxID=2828781 RepID=A0A9J6P0V4_9CLOT|nr:ABC transporter permease [Oceanirhabdus seepicola]MCM1990271.1 ABC transporter permease [Oceanirhabdus seepicola]